MATNILTKIFGTANDRIIKKFHKEVQKINQLEEALQNLTDEELRDKTKQFKQKLSDGSLGKDYWLSGLVAEKLWKTFSAFINFENFGDVRQTRFENIFSGTVPNPVREHRLFALSGAGRAMTSKSVRPWAANIRPTVPTDR